MKSLLFTAILSIRKRSEQILIKFAILLQVRMTHAQTFFRSVPRTSNTTEKRLRMRVAKKMARNLNAKL
jgi:fumarate reductase subunit C